MWGDPRSDTRDVTPSGDSFRPPYTRGPLDDQDSHFDGGFGPGFSSLGRGIRGLLSDTLRLVRPRRQTRAQRGPRYPPTRPQSPKTSFKALPSVAVTVWSWNPASSRCVTSQLRPRYRPPDRLRTYGPDRLGRRRRCPTLGRTHTLPRLALRPYELSCP